MDGKEKCRALKQIRKQIAENNDIAYVVEECKHKGKCKGTCPKCEAEVRYLEKELEKRRNMGKKVAIAGVSMGIAATFSACTPTPADIIDSVTYPIRQVFNIGGGQEYSGDVQYVPDYAGEALPPEELEGEPIEYVDSNNDPDIEVLDGEAPPEPEELDGDVEYNPDSEDIEGTAPADTDLLYDGGLADDGLEEGEAPSDN